MSPKTPNYECIHEELLQNHTLEINNITKELDYKKEKLDDLKKDNEKIQATLKNIQDNVNSIVLASKKDDDKLKDLVNKQDQRITALETTNTTLKWVIGLGFTALTCLVGVLAFLISHLH